MSTVSTLSGPPASTRVDGGYNQRRTEPALAPSGSLSGGVDPTRVVNEWGTKFLQSLMSTPPGGGKAPAPPPKRRDTRHEGRKKSRRRAPSSPPRDPVPQDDCRQS